MDTDTRSRARPHLELVHGCAGLPELPPPRTVERTHLLRVVSGCVSVEEFTARYGRCATADSIVLPLKRTQTVGEEIHVEVMLSDRATRLIRGKATIRSDRAGAGSDERHGYLDTCLQFVDLDDASRALLEEMSSTQLADPPTGEWSISHRRITALPLPPPPPPLLSSSRPITPCGEDTEVRCIDIAKPDANPWAIGRRGAVETLPGFGPFCLPAALPGLPPVRAQAPATAELAPPIEHRAWPAMPVAYQPAPVRPSGRKLVAAWCVSFFVGLAFAYGLWGEVEPLPVSKAHAAANTEAATVEAGPASVPTPAAAGELAPWVEAEPPRPLARR